MGLPSQRSGAISKQIALREQDNFTHVGPPRVSGACHRTTRVFIGLQPKTADFELQIAATHRLPRPLVAKRMAVNHKHHIAASKENAENVVIETPVSREDTEVPPNCQAS